ncbi:MAG: lactate racemase domain-containing protein [Deltaproteobacteria bacterium]|nr:lactate racemase domain-containing protein [Deltaproteobacteria bacterium]
MSIIPDLIKNAVIPEFYALRQSFPDDGIKDIPAAVVRALEESGIASTLPKGEIAIGVGSRGVANIPAVTRATVDWFRNKGARPFIIPCMGSHGGATAEGQNKVLGDLGVTEESAGCAIRSSMEVVHLGSLDNGLPVYMDENAWNAAGVFVINRIKAHTSFSGPNESGLLKMLTIGLGKQKGADAAHTYGNAAFKTIMPSMARMTMRRKPGILGGLALIENERDRTCRVEAVPANVLEQRDAELLLYAKSRMPSLPVDQLDLLIVDRIGKNISGSGMDTNITGRHATAAKSGGPDVSRLVVLRLTRETKGNAAGIGMADIVPRSLADSINFEYTYANIITSTNLPYVRLPMVLETEEDVVRCGIKTCLGRPESPRIACIRDTLSIDRLLVSKALADSLQGHARCSVSATPVRLVFSADGQLDQTVWTAAFN